MKSIIGELLSDWFGFGKQPTKPIDIRNFERMTQGKYHKIDLCKCLFQLISSNSDDKPSCYNQLYCHTNECPALFTADDEYIYICEICENEYCTKCATTGMTCHGELQF